MSLRGTMSTRLNRQQFGARACVLLISIMLATTRVLGQGLQRSAEKSGEGQTASQKHESLDQKASSSCSAKVPDIDPSANPKSTASKESFTYTPLSSNCKFQLFVKQTYSPYTFASAGFEGTWAQATAQWPQYGGGMAGFGKRFGAALADTESRRFVHSFALSTILHQDPRYFPSARRTLGQVTKRLPIPSLQNVGAIIDGKFPAIQGNVWCRSRRQHGKIRPVHRTNWAKVKNFARDHVTRSQSRTQTPPTISKRANIAIMVAVLASLSFSGSSGSR